MLEEKLDVLVVADVIDEDTKKLMMKRRSKYFLFI